MAKSNKQIDRNIVNRILDGSSAPPTFITPDKDRCEHCWYKVGSVPPHHPGCMLGCGHPNRSGTCPGCPKPGLDGY